MSRVDAAPHPASGIAHSAKPVLSRALHWLLPFAFVAFCGPLGVVMAVNTPPGQVPDEHAHAVKADSLIEGVPLGYRAPAMAPDGTVRPLQGVYADPALVVVGNRLSPGELTAAHWAQLHAVRWGAPTFLAFLGTIAGYFPAFYSPAAAGLAVAKALGASPFDSFITARLFAFAVFMAAGTAALALARWGQCLLFCTLAVPMALHLGASMNQDGELIAASALAVALLTRSCADGLAIRSGRDVPRIGAAALIGCVALAKPPYLPMAALLLFPLPPFRFGRVWAARLALAGAVALATVAWTWFTVRYVSTPVIRPPAEAGPLWPGPRPAIFAGTDFAGQMRVLMAKPIRFLTLPWHTLIHDGILWDEAIGRLGYLDIVLPNWLYGLWSWAAISAVAADVLWRRDRAATLPIWQAAVPLLGIAVAVLGIYLSQYLSWTEVGGDHVEGPQGRYFLPLVPMLAFALPSLGRHGTAGTALRLLPAAACLADVAVVPGLLIRYFYMH